DARVVLLLREVEGVAVGIGPGIGGEGPGRGALDEARLGIFAPHAFEHGLDIVDAEAEMIEPGWKAVAARIDVEPDASVADGDSVERPPFGGRRQPQAEDRLVEAAEQRPLRADQRDMIDLREHGSPRLSAISTTGSAWPARARQAASSPAWSRAPAAPRRARGR